METKTLNGNIQSTPSDFLYKHKEDRKVKLHTNFSQDNKKISPPQGNFLSFGERYKNNNKDFVHPKTVTRSFFKVLIF